MTRWTEKKNKKGEKKERLIDEHPNHDHIDMASNQGP